MGEYQDWLDAEGPGSELPAGSRWIVKAATPGHPRSGHEGYASLSTAASATMLPQAAFELAQLELPPPVPPTAGAPQALGARHQLKLFVAVTSVQPPRAYVFDGGVLTLRDREAIAQAVAKTTAKAAAAGGTRAPLYAHWMGAWNGPDASGLGADAVAKQLGKRGARKLRARAEAAATSVFRWLSLPGRLGDPHGDLQFSIGEGEKRERGGRARRPLSESHLACCRTRGGGGLTLLLSSSFSLFSKPQKKLVHKQTKNSPQLRL